MPLSPPTSTAGARPFSSRRIGPSATSFVSVCAIRRGCRPPPCRAGGCGQCQRRGVYQLHRARRPPRAAHRGDEPAHDAARHAGGHETRRAPGGGAAAPLTAGPRCRYPTSMTARERFLRACRKQAVDRPPIWFMRQAGRYMPEYRALRREYSILEICKRPDLAAQVTATAVERLNVDAAIIFADLLLPAEPLGLELRYAAGEGPIVTPPVRDREAVAKLDGELRGRLGYVAEAIRRAQSALGSEMPIIGFAGAPFTLASYLIEGGAKI